MRRLPGRRRPALAAGILVAAALGAAALAPAGAPAQSPDSLAPPPPPPRVFPPGFAAAAVDSDSAGTMVAAAIRIPAGSAQDPEGDGGTAWLLARVVESLAAERLAPGEASLTARVGRSSTTFTLLTLPSRWERTLDEALDLVFTAELPPRLLERHRAELSARLAFEAGSPVEDFRREAASMRAPPGDPWGRPIRGTPSSVGTPATGPDTVPASFDDLSVRDLEAWRLEHWRRSRSVLGLAGPVPPSPTLAPRAAAPAELPYPWLVGNRVVLRQEVTSAWISVAFPIPRDADWTAMEMVAFSLQEELLPEPPPPDQYGVEIRFEETPRGRALVVDATVLAEAADRWEGRILAAVERLAEVRETDEFFRWSRRRFRAGRLLADAAPEDRAARIAEDLARDGSVRDLQRATWALDARGLQAAAASLEEPRILRLEADLGS